jgi:clan AA aspartic protease
MGKVMTEITLSNVKDEGLCKAGVRDEVRQLTVDAVVDTGASTLIINEELQRRLGLEIVGTRRITLADGGKKECGLTEAVTVRWKNRLCACGAVVIPGLQSVLLGAIPLEDMDLVVNPLMQELVGAHGDVVEALAL